MVVTSVGPVLPPDLRVFYALDHTLSDAIFIVAFGPSSTPNVAVGANGGNTSRIQTHVFSPAGYSCFPRLAISPGSPLYSAVIQLSRDDQGDDSCRALAYSLNKFFSELDKSTKTLWVEQNLTTDKPTAALSLFTDVHAAELAGRMDELHNGKEILHSLMTGFASISTPFIDMDVVLPSGSIKEPSSNRESLDLGGGSSPASEARYGPYAPLIDLLGETAFIPTSRVKRAPSKPTAINRSPAFTRTQKESLRKELCELVDTEESYVEKLFTLVQTTAAKFRKQAGASDTPSSAKSSVDALFPPCLDTMLSVNSHFLDAFRKILEETEAAAIADIESTSSYDRGTPGQDATGAEVLATCLLEWFPKFLDSYGAFMGLHTAFAAHIKHLSACTGSAFPALVQATGEQHLTSALIEPIQRLPRYSLYIDSITKQLPIRHPALRKFLKAKDIISDICAQDSEETGALLQSRIATLIDQWPPHKPLPGRLISAADALEIAAPYNADASGDVQDHLIFLLCSEALVVLRRIHAEALTARGLLAEIDNPKPTTAEGDALKICHLQFVETISLHTMELTVLGHEKLLRLTPLVRAQEACKTCIRVFKLGGAYESKPSRFVRDVAKARVEGRYSEAERDSFRWEARELHRDDLQLSTFAAILEDNTVTQRDRERPDLSATRVLIDCSTPTLTTSAGGALGPSIVASISVKDQGFYELEASTYGHHRTRDVVTSTEFLPVLVKRLSNLLQMQNYSRSPALQILLLRHHQAILSCLRLPLKKRGRSESKLRGLRPISHSPVKALTSLFSRDNDTKLAGFNFAQIPQLKPVARSQPQSNLEASANVSIAPLKPTVTLPSDGDPQSNSVDALERTLASYLLALRARKGNVVGRSLANRVMVDDATVNELYNSLLEDPTNHELPAQAPVDVLFVAFERFLKNAWQDQVGPVVALSTLSEMQQQSDFLSPLDYEEYLLAKIDELSPQNQRALKAIIGLLVDLLEGTTNDADRGALVATMTQILVCEGNSHDFMPLLDRFVAEHDVILNDSFRTRQGTPGSVASNAARSADTGSVSSKASSISRRLGFGSLQRENSKSEPSSKLGSVLRTWSKNGRNENPSRSMLNRTRSVEMDALPTLQGRPASRDRPGVAGIFPQSSSQSPASGLEPVDGAQMPPGLPRKKRRSSLSDIERLPTPNMSPLYSSSAFHGIGNTPRHAQPPSESPLMPTRHYGGSISALATSPLRSNAVKHKSPLRKENEQPASHLSHAVTPSLGYQEVKRRPMSMVDPFAPTVGSAVNHANHSRTSSSIPVPRGVLSERPSSGNTPPPPLMLNGTSAPSPAASPKKTILQSSDNLDDRLRRQKSSVESTQSSLQTELENIGRELNKTDLTRKNSVLRTGSPTKGDSATHVLQLNTRVKALETKYAHMLRNLASHVETLDVQVKNSTRALEGKVVALEDKLKDAGAENDVLFERNNEELGRIFKRVKEGQGVEELKMKLAESLNEAARLKRENAKLEVEVIGLRAVAGVDGGSKK